MGENHKMKKNKKTLLLSAMMLSLGLSFSSATLAGAAMPSSAVSSTQGEQLPTLAPMLESVLPAVVSVYVEGVQVQRQQIPEEFKFFFGPNLPTEREKPFEGLGSGVIIDAEKGYIITNNHVVTGANTIRIQLNDGREFDAKLVGKDEQSDIALLQITDKNPKGLVQVAFADSDKLRVGDYAVAIGNPFGLGQTATSGIISALARSGLTMEGFENFIQTDASINRGNSGGALVNLNGELIGMNTAILAPTGGNIGIGFAIPSNMVVSFTKQLIEFGEVKRGQLGIKGGEMTAEMAKALKVDAQRGAFVSEVLPDQSAAKAGIKAGDVIISIEGKPIHGFAELRAKVATAGAGAKLKMGLIRDGKEVTVDVTLQENVADATNAASIAPVFKGATLSNGTVKGQQGVLVDDVEKNSSAFRVGLRKGDLILAVNKEKVTTVAELRKLVDAKPSIMAINILRGNDQMYLILR